MANTDKKSNKMKWLDKPTKILLIILAVLVAIPALGAVIYKTNESYINTMAIYTLVPKQTTMKVSTGEMEFHLQLKDKFKHSDYDKDLYAISKRKINLQAFECYYLDDSGEKVFLENPLVYDDNGTEVDITFLDLEGLGSVNTIKNTVIAVYVLLIGADIILLWFFSWSRREDEKKARQFEQINKQNKKKK